MNQGFVLTYLLLNRSAAIECMHYLKIPCCPLKETDDFKYLDKETHVLLWPAYSMAFSHIPLVPACHIQFTALGQLPPPPLLPSPTLPVGEALPHRLATFPSTFMLATVRHKYLIGRPSSLSQHLLKNVLFTFQTGQIKSFCVCV